MQLILLNRFQNLVIENKIQNVKIFQENIIKCNYVSENNRIDAVLSFNDELCFIGVESQKVNNVTKLSVLHERDEHLFTLNRNQLSNCAYRLGTDTLIQEQNN